MSLFLTGRQPLLVPLPWFLAAAGQKQARGES
jgi:hypothetical protein